MYERGSTTFGRPSQETRRYWAVPNIDEARTMGLRGAVRMTEPPETLRLFLQ
jgi:hypothetical protein